MAEDGRQADGPPRVPRGSGGAGQPGCRPRVTDLGPGIVLLVAAAGAGLTFKTLGFPDKIIPL